MIKDTIDPGTLVYTDEYSIYARLQSWGYGHKHVNHGQGEFARDDDGDGLCEVHVNTMEGFWSLLRSWLRPHRGISQEKLPLYLGFFESLYLGFFEFVHNVRKRGKALLGSLIELLVSKTPDPNKSDLSIPTVTGEGNRTFRVVSNCCTPASTLGGGRGNVCVLISRTRSVVLSLLQGSNRLSCYWATVTIQPTPKRSVTMPKHGDQNVLPRGICTCPPSASASNVRPASAASTAVNARENPENAGHRCNRRTP